MMERPAALQVDAHLDAFTHVELFIREVYLDMKR